MSLFYEMDKSFADLLGEKRNFLFIGEAGSGKSELALNTAAMLAERYGGGVDVFDMDQTKPLYRSRDLKESFAEKGVEIFYQEQYLDAPTLVGGVAQSLLGDGYTILDIGGGHQAARMAGGYSHILKRDDAVPVYVVNPFRPWTKSVESIDETMLDILRAVRLDRIYLLGNPNLGRMTTAEDVLTGLARLDELFEGFAEVNSAFVKSDIIDAVRDKTDKCLIPLTLHLTYEWE